MARWGDGTARRASARHRAFAQAWACPPGRLPDRRGRTAGRRPAAGGRAAALRGSRPESEGQNRGNRQEGAESRAVRSIKNSDFPCSLFLKDLILLGTIGTKLLIK